MISSLFTKLPLVLAVAATTPAQAGIFPGLSPFANPANQPKLAPSTQPTDPQKPAEPMKPIRHGRLKASITKITFDATNGPNWDAKPVCTQEIALPVYDLRVEPGEITFDEGYFGCESTLKDIGAVKVWAFGSIMLTPSYLGGQGDMKGFISAFAVTDPNYDPKKDMDGGTEPYKWGYSTFATRDLGLKDGLMMLQDDLMKNDGELKFAENFFISVEILDADAPQTK